MKYTDEQWQEIFKKVDESELSANQWCLQNNVPYGSYKYHRYDKKGDHEKTDVKSDHRLVKVKIVDNDIHTNSTGLDIVIGKASIKVNSVGDLNAVAHLINLINEA